MNEFASRFDSKFVTDLVLMNEDLCFHKAEFPVHQKEMAFAIPIFVFVPPSKDKEMEVYIQCPICYRKYPEAAARLEKEIRSFMAQNPFEKITVSGEGSK